jgi:hypothetical protein
MRTGLPWGTASVQRGTGRSPRTKEHCSVLRGTAEGTDVRKYPRRPLVITTGLAYCRALGRIAENRRHERVHLILQRCMLQRCVATLHVACCVGCMLHVACCVLHAGLVMRVACCVVHVAHLRVVPRHMSYVAGCTLRVVCCMLHAV